MDHLGVWFVASFCMTHWHKSIKQIAPSIVTCNLKVSCFGFVFDVSGFYVPLLMGIHLLPAAVDFLSFSMSCFSVHNNF